jgi:hypothetical protein
VCSGNLGLLTPFIALFFSLMIFLYQRCFNTRLPRGYAQAEKDDVLNQLAVLLLLAKDGKLQDPNNKQKMQVLRIAKELEVLSRQLSKQYEHDDKKKRKRRMRWKGLKKDNTHRKDSISNANTTSSNITSNGEGDSDSEQDVEMHYGHYELLPAKAFAEEQI